jgi:protein-disulfide isomerase
LGIGAIGASWWLSRSSNVAISTTVSGDQFQAELGPADAPVTVIEYSDFQCPACGYFAREIKPELVSRYIAAGKVRFVYRHYAFLGPESGWAAQASLCAADQGRFWDYHDKLFASQAGENRGAFRRENLKRFARELGLDGARFDPCLDSREHEREVVAQKAEAERKGVQATPTLFINDRKLEGVPRSFEALAALIEERLK